MHAMVLKHFSHPLEWTELPDKQPGPGEIRVKVGACGVCRTDLHVVDGELPQPRGPIIAGHEIVGRIDAIGTGADGLTLASAWPSRGSATPVACAPSARLRVDLPHVFEVPSRQNTLRVEHMAVLIGKDVQTGESHG